MSDPLSVAGSVVGIVSLGLRATQQLFDVCSAWKDQHAEISRSTNKLNDLLDLLTHIHAFISDRGEEASLSEACTLIEKHIKTCQENIAGLTEHLDKYTQSEDGKWKSRVNHIVNRVAYSFKHEDLQQLESAIDGTVPHLQTALSLLQELKLKQIKADLEEIKSLASRARSEHLNSNILQWLKAPDFSSDFHACWRKRHPNTGLWLIRSPRFESWLEHPNSGGSSHFLWVNGFAGTGKSILSATIIQHVLRQREDDPRVGIAFFFFKFDDPQKQSGLDLLRALVLQLAGQQSDEKVLQRLFQNKQHITPSNELLLSHVQDLLSTFERTYIILDALDEAPLGDLRNEVLDVLNTLLEASNSHVLVTSRNEEDIRLSLAHHLEVNASAEVRMRDGSVNKDIAAHISSVLQKDPKLARWKKYHARIQQVLTKRADGVFRWVDCSLTSFRTGYVSPKNVETLLSSLPPTLDKWYERMLLDIPEDNKEIAQRLLTLVSCARRPLYLGQILDALAIELGDPPRFNRESKLEDDSGLGWICPSLVEVRQSIRGEPPKVQFAHFSVQEFLRSSRIGRSAAASFGLSRLNADRQMARVCLAYLADPCVEISESTVFSTSFADYAIYNWIYHLRDSQEELIVDAMRFLQNADKLHGWLRRESWHPLDDCQAQTRQSSVSCVLPIYVACAKGLLVVLQELLRAPGMAALINNSSCLVTEETDFRPPTTALGVAAWYGHGHIIDYICDTVADVDYEEALLVACNRGQESIAQRLLELEGPPYRNRDILLHSAIAVGSINLVQKVLGGEPDTDLSVKGETWYDLDSMTPLSRACWEGHLDIARLLLDRGADPDVGEGDALFRAISSPYTVGCVELLLQRGADPYLGIFDAINAEKYVELLIQYCPMSKAPLDVELAVAIYRGDRDRFYDILNNSTNLNALRGGALMMACGGHGSLDLMIALLERGADPNAIENLGAYLLSKAMDDDHLDIAKLLVEKGAVIDTPGFPLQLALMAMDRERDGLFAIDSSTFDKPYDVQERAKEYIFLFLGASNMGC